MNNYIIDLNHIGKYSGYGMTSIVVCKDISEAWEIARIRCKWWNKHGSKVFGKYKIESVINE